MRLIIDILKDVFCYIVSFFYRKQNLWLVMERGTDARDNGYWFFKYLIDNHSDQTAIYVISKDSPDLEKVKKCGPVVEYNSIKHGIYYYAAKYRVGTHQSLARPEWRAIEALQKKTFVRARGYTAFLQHGIIKDNIPGLKYPNFVTDLFICGAKPEFEFINRSYGFEDGVVRYTGLARFDNLTRNADLKKKQVLLMPTWRTFLFGKEKSEFESSQYFNKYQGLLDSEELHRLLELNDYDLIFYPHYEIQRWISSFTSKSNRVKIASFKDYDVQKLLIESEILITDYSSVFFDMAYMNRETIFFQFDKEKYRASQYQEGYFKYEDSFGPVVESVEEVIICLADYFKNGVAKKYQSNMNKYFVFHDENNSYRIFKAITDIKKG